MILFKAGSTNRIVKIVMRLARADSHQDVPLLFHIPNHPISNFSLQ
jgi:hypothetical protein